MHWPGGTNKESKESTKFNEITKKYEKSNDYSETELPIRANRLLEFFFFQAEDGIRDADVTGVQTCALPIYKITYREKSKLHKNLEQFKGIELDKNFGIYEITFASDLTIKSVTEISGFQNAIDKKIGRASCRERV